MFTLIQLPYALDALEPIISSHTISFHHGKHLQSYVDNLNRLIAGKPLESQTLEDIVCNSEGAIFNNAGQILNHNLYFTQFCAPSLSGSPSGALADQILCQWSSLETFKEEFVSKGVSLFGSGWVWLSADKDGSLVITQEIGASNPITHGLTPLLTFDVWEHAYYLDYQNRRADHLNGLWRIADWTTIEKRYLRLYK